MWIDNSRRRLFLDMHFPDWSDHQTGTNFEPRRIARAIKDARFDSVVLFAKCQYGNFYYDTNTGHKHAGLGSQDFFRETATLLKNEGIHVIAYYSVAWDEWQAKHHPNWQVQKADGTPGTGEYRWSTLCVNTPYRETVKTQLAEIARELQPDGFWIDMTIIGKDACFCPTCKEKYQQQFGREMVFPFPDDAAHNRFIQFRYDYIESFYAEIYTLIRGIDSGIKITNNYWGYPYSSYTMGSRATGALLQADYVTGEAYTDWTGLSAPGFFPKWLRSVAGGRPYEALIGRFIGTWDYTKKPPAQLAQECYTCAINGACVTLDDEPYADGSLDWQLYEELGKINAEIEKREPWLKGRQMRHGAIFHSQLSKDYFLQEEAFISSIAGAYRMMKELQSPCDFLFDDAFTLEKANAYRFLFLPSVAVVNDTILEVLLHYVEQGGTLFASGETASHTVQNDTAVRFDQFEKRLGLVCDGPSEYTISYLHPVDKTILGAVGTCPLTVRSPYVKYETEHATVLATITNPICETTKERFFHNNLPSPYERTSWPALLEIPYGRGKVLLFSQNVFTQFGRYHQMELKQLFHSLLEKGGLLPPVRFDCSSNVETSIFEENGKWIIHLVNMAPGMTLCMGKMDSFEAKYPRTFEYIDRVSTLYNLSIELDLPGVKSAHEIPTGQTLPVIKTASGCQVVLPKLKEWATIVLSKE